MNNQFPLPSSCADAIPYFELSDILREFAIFYSDLVAAFYIRKKALLVCQNIMVTLNGNEREYVHQVLVKLVEQLQELKQSYNPSEDIGLVLFLQECYVASSS